MKAANTRALTPFIVQLAEEFYCDESQKIDLMVSRAANALNRFYEILYSADIFLTDGEITQLRHALAMLGSSAMSLRMICQEVGVFAWQVTPKMHAIQHVSSFPCRLNPRWVQCYHEESGIGSTTAVWSRSAVGRYRKNVQRMVLLKKLVSLIVRLETNGRV